MSQQDPAVERYNADEAELKLVEAKLSQKLDQIAESAGAGGEERKEAVREAESLVKEAKEQLEAMRLTKESVPASLKNPLNVRQRNHQSDVDALGRRLKALGVDRDRAALLGQRYRDDPEAGDEHLEQRQQLLSGTERLTRSSARLQSAQRTANDTEAVGAGILQDLAGQREVLERTHETLGQSEGYTDRSLKTLKGMARRMATNRIITVAIITVLVILIIAVIVSKFR